MKTAGLLLLVLFLPPTTKAQRSLSGLWVGTISNDSLTVRKDQSFEIALTQYKQKVYGYTRSSFIVNDTLYYIVKRVKGTIDGDICEIKDDEIVSYNFPGRLDKGVRMSTTFRMNQKDTSWYLAGDWTTNKVKNRFYAITGKIDLKEEKDFNRSKLFPHLEELNLGKDVEFYAASKKPATPASKPQKDMAANTNKEKKANKPALLKDSAAVAVKGDETVPVFSVSRNEPAAFVKERASTMPQLLNFISDSLQLSLYDNGEIDGDTVSVLLNGDIILAKQLLKASALKKTIYIQPGTDELTLVLYAENLGKYPPNTGLLVVRDGDQTYQVRFSADLQQNASVIFRRKK